MIYKWEAGDCMAWIAWKFRRPKQTQELIDHNISVLRSNSYRLPVGTEIEIPSDWFPLPTHIREVKISGSHGHVTINTLE